MRGEKLKALLPDWEFEVIDIDIPFQGQNRFFRSLGFRYKLGPAVTAINKFIQEHLKNDQYDLVWIDKAMLISPELTSELRKRTARLIHYTPDTAFYANRSRMFYKSIHHYDFLVTTKKFELSSYQNLVAKEKILLVTQAFDKKIHQPVVKFENKYNRVAFVGLYERPREDVIQLLIDNNISVTLAGFKWEEFVRKNKNNPLLEFKGSTVWEKEYTSLISSCFFSLGLLSKRFPELHTTRTFEIPACGTALLTERNEDTASFFTEEQVIFYKGPSDLINKIKYYQQDLEALKIVTDKGTKIVNGAGFDYQTILSGVLNKILEN